MAAFVKYNPFAEKLPEKAFDLGADTLKILLSNTAPDVTDAIKTDAAEISAGNGYSAGGTQATTSSSAQTGGTYKLVLADVVFTATPASINSFRYPILYDDTATNDELIGSWDYGSSVAPGVGETFTWDADATTGVITLA